MRRSASLLPALAAVLLLATACGTEHPGTAAGAGASATAPGIPVTDPPVDGVRITALNLPTASPSAEPSDGPSGIGSVHADRLPTPGVPDRPGEIPAGTENFVESGISAAYEVTNDGKETLTYTVLFSFTTSTGEVMGNQRETVRGVAPGRTVRGTVQLGRVPPGMPEVRKVKVSEVTTVPADEAPAETGTCPASGIRVTADDGDAAMGLRVVGLRLENCGTRDYTLDGYPRLTLLDEDLEPVDGIDVVHGGAGVALVTGFDDPPRPVTLEPGEYATSGLMWRNTTGAGTAVNVPHVRVHAKPGAAPVIVTPRLDLGTTGKLGVSAWKRGE
ncbi:DUF4232 domain-containing protein [Streptomyces antibioticus]|uniref:DUF4232 domain-containing protein n=1 Tax=Streptomyces antibioticus TaxID=1890 RepID=A0AAE7CN73_STRAT|nr:DUF4232 domain-containing protein [Streptomyces antibioticus]OOQ46834.1 hypothetical protein AFM16_28925 [Streptomyces antibioticus]QIT47137.1 DUF4232 domain-containing protein [Streptomyces antibioticus]